MWAAALVVALAAALSAAEVSDVTSLSRFDELVGGREEVWVVVFSAGRDGARLPAHVIGVVATNGDVHPAVLKKLGELAIESAAAK